MVADISYRFLSGDVSVAWSRISERHRAATPLFGVLTNERCVWRLAPGVLDELKRAMPRDEKGRKIRKILPTAHEECRLPETSRAPWLGGHNDEVERRLAWLLSDARRATSATRRISFRVSRRRQRHGPVMTRPPTRAAQQGDT